MTKATQGGRAAKAGRWIGSSKADLSVVPEDVKRRVGGAIWEAQTGLKGPFAKPLKGFGGATRRPGIRREPA
jgi:phage-related protein